MPPDASIRVLVPGEEMALESHLVRYWASSMTLRSALRFGGVMNQGHPAQATWVAAWDRQTILGVAAHFNDGSLVLQAPRSLGLIARSTVTYTRLPVTRIMGPWSQVEACVGELGMTPAAPDPRNRPKHLASIEVSRLDVPEILRKPGIGGRMGGEVDVEALVQMRIAADFGGAKLAEQQIAMLRAGLQQQIAAHGVYVAEMQQRPLAMISYDVWLPDAAQLSRVLYAPGLTDPKERSPAAVAVLEAAVGAAAYYGAKRACLLMDKSDNVLQSIYRPLQFSLVADFGTYELTG